MKEWIARIGLTLLFVDLVWSFALPPMWPPSRLWIPVLILIPASGWGAGLLWLRYFEEQSIQREIRERKQRLDRPAGRPDRGRADMGQREEAPRPTRAEPPTWPPPPDKQAF